MRQAGRIANQDDGQRLVDHLLTLGIEARSDPEEDGSATLWVYDETELERTQSELERFSADPAAARYDGSASSAKRLREDAEKAVAEDEKRFIDVRKRWRGGFTRGSRPVTYALVALSVAVALSSQFGQDRASIIEKLFIASYRTEGGYIYYWPGLSQIRRGEVWRLVTPIFIHFDLMHLVFNMMWLLYFGPQIEDRKRWFRYLLLILVIAIPSNLAQYLFGAPNFGGMSGVVYGVFGYVWMKTRYEPDSGMFVPQPIVWFQLLFLALGFSGILNVLGPTANWCHLGGLVMGCLFGARRYLIRRLRTLAGG